MRTIRTQTITRYLLISTLLIALSGIAILNLVERPQKAHAAPIINIMPLGDSITGSPGCWRALLWNNLINTGYTNINFVGTLNNSSSCGVPFDGDNEGHGGYLATNIANQNLLPGWLSATNPDIVMMHLGTNDVWNNIAPATILAAFTTLVNQMRANNPNMKILVAQITPMNPTGCSACAQRVINFNAAIPAWASSESTTRSPIVVVDQWTGYNDSTDTIDGVHPNASGNAKIAARWYPALTAQINSIDAGNGGGSTPTPTPTPGKTPTPTPTPNPTVTPTPTPGTGGSGCKVSYAVNQWPGGFTANMTITNTGSTALNGWTLAFTFPGSQQVTQGWNAIISQQGSKVTVVNEPYNATLAAGASITPGFNGSWTGSNPAPTAFTLNGTACSIA